ncbi:MAG: hypothetical protein ACE5JF_01525 [Anaerolineales bacterium]
MMTPEAEAVARLVERTKARLDELLLEYTELYELADPSSTATTGEREFANLSLIPIWNEIWRTCSANKTDD